MTERFRALAETVRHSRGMTDAPYVVLPATEDTEYGDPVKMDAVVDEALPKILALLSTGDV